jgi:ATP-dependent protease ClpP protease subunit
MYALNSGHNDWYRIRNQIDGPTQLHIYDEIGYFGVSASDMIRDLADVTGPLEVHLNSPGGEVFDGIAIYNALVARRDVTIMIDGLAASIASVIAMAGNPVLIARQAQVMVHDGFGMSIGNAKDMREMAELLDKTSNNIASIYSDHTGRTQDYWRAVMQAETWYSGQEAIDAGLADRFIDSGAGRSVQPASDTWDMSVFRGDRGKPHPSQASVPPPRWDGDEDGDDDGSPDGDTDHSHWNESGRQIQSVPGMPLDRDGNRIDIANASVDNSPWDAGRALHNAVASDSPAAFLNGICAGKKAGDPATQDAHALPHHYHPGDAPNAAGVRNALARLSGTQGLTNKEAAQSHLEAHMRAINPDWKPSGSAGDVITDEDVERFINTLKGA